MKVIYQIFSRVFVCVNCEPNRKFQFANPQSSIINSSALVGAEITSRCRDRMAHTGEVYHTSAMKVSIPLHLVVICAVAFLIPCRSSENFTSTSRISDDGVSGECGIYLAPSLTVALGRALIAGNDFASGQVLASTIALAVRHDDFESTQLMDYLFETHEEDILIVAIGLDMMFNHREIESVERTSENFQIRNYAEQKVAHTTYNDVILSTVSNVSGRFCHDDLTRHRFQLIRSWNPIHFIAGEELFCSYGDAQWFESRNFSPSEDIQDVRKTDSCLACLSFS